MGKTQKESLGQIKMIQNNNKLKYEFKKKDTKKLESLPDFRDRDI